MLEITLSDAHGVPTCTALQVATHFAKRHDNVLRDIRELDCSPEFLACNFIESSSVNPQNGQAYTDYHLSRDGFAFLCMGYTGAKAAHWKESYIKAFNANAAALQLSQDTLQRIAQATYDTNCAHVHALTLFSYNLRDAEVELIARKNHPGKPLTSAMLDEASGHYTRHHNTAALHTIQQAVKHRADSKALLDSLPKPDKPLIAAPDKPLDADDIAF